MIKAGATPKATTSESESSSAPNRLCPRSRRATRPSSPSSSAAIPMNISALSHSAVIAKRMPERPEQSASAVIALGTTARRGMPGRSRGGSVIAPASLRDALDQLGDAGPPDDGLAGNGALAEQDLARRAG